MAARLILDILELAKIRILSMVLVATAVGYMMGQSHVDWGHLGMVLIATMLVGGGINALNQVWEKDLDRLMARTAERPLPTGRIASLHAALVGLVATFTGLALLWIWANPLAVLVGILVGVTYVLCYTPLKTRTSLNTLVGAVPGALPPVLGWVSARGELGLEALALFLIIFMWQPPHFMAIAWLYRKDYEAAGMPMITVGERGEALTRKQMVLYAIALVPVSLYPSVIGMAGAWYFGGALILGLAFLAIVLWMAKAPSDQRAAVVLRASVIYLPVLFSLLLFDAGAL